MAVWSDIDSKGLGDPAQELMQFRIELNRRLRFALSNINVTQFTGSLNELSGTLALSKGGTGQSLSAPAGDSAVFYDVSGNKIDWLALGNSLGITGTTLDAIQDIRTSASPTFTNTISTGYTQGATGKFGNVAGGNYSEFEADGTLKANGTATTFEDLQFPIGSGRVAAANAPTWETFTTNTSEYSFAVNDFIDLQAGELFHSWKVGSQAEFHGHVAPKTANTSGASRYAKFILYVAYADATETWTETSLTAELTIPNGTAALTHFLLDLGDVAFTNQLIGCQIKLRVKRVAATGGTEYAANVFITQVGSHLERDTLGSRTEYTK